MKELNSVIKWVKAVDIKKDEDWTWKLTGNKDLTEWQKGYMGAKLEQFGNCLCSDDEEYREEVLEVLQGFKK